MNERASDNSDDWLPIEAAPEHPSPPPLAAEIVVSRDGPAKCTIYPPKAADFERLTQWITAEEDSFVSLDSMR